MGHCLAVAKGLSFKASRNVPPRGPMFAGIGCGTARIPEAGTSSSFSVPSINTPSGA